MGVECISGEEEFTTASDVWSWAVTIWEVSITFAVLKKLLG